MATGDALRRSSRSRPSSWFTSDSESGRREKAAAMLRPFRVCKARVVVCAFLPQRINQAAKVEPGLILTGCGANAEWAGSHGSPAHLPTSPRRRFSNSGFGFALPQVAGEHLVDHLLDVGKEETAGGLR